MCGGVRYTIDGRDYQVYFPNPKAKLPVMRKQGEVVLLPWGRRKEQSGNLPLGGWARLDSIYSGRWNKYDPVPVKIPVDEFMEKDIAGKSHWFEVTAGKFIQGLVAKIKYEQRVYVVTITPEDEFAVHDRWPRVVSGM